MSPFRRTTTLHRTRTIFALAVAALLALSVLANSAQAGCGDYVFVRNANGKLVRASDLMKDHGACTGPNCPGYHSSSAGLESISVSPTESPIKMPCNGPNCSSRSQWPAAPAAPVAPPSARESAALFLRVTSDDRESGALLSGAPTNNELELRYPQAIFHPPR